MWKDFRPEMNKKYNTIAAYTLVVALIIVAVVMLAVFIVPISGFFSKVLDLLSPVFYGFAFAYVLCPLCNWLDKYFYKLMGDKKIHRFLNPILKKLSIVVTYIVVVVLFIGFFNIVIPEVRESANTFAETYKDNIVKVDNFFNAIARKTGLLNSEPAKSLEKLVIEKLEEFSERAVNAVAEFSPVIITNVFGFAKELWNIVLGIIISIYMLSERKTFARQGKKLIYGLFSENTAIAIDEGFSKTHRIFGGFVGGKILDSAIIGVMCFIGLYFLKMPHAALVSIIVGATNIIPYFGPFIGAIPSFIIIFLDSPMKAIVFALFILALQQLDGNVIGPAILKETVGVSSFWIITSLLVMGVLPE